MAQLSFFKSIKQRDPAAKSSLQILLFYPGVHALISYRVANFLYRHRLKVIAEIVSAVSRRKTGVEIHPAAVIGKRLFIDHGAGVVIGETAQIGDNCTIYQGVTLGGTGKDRGKSTGQHYNRQQRKNRRKRHCFNRRSRQLYRCGYRTHNTQKQLSLDIIILKLCSVLISRCSCSCLKIFAAV